MPGCKTGVLLSLGNSTCRDRLIIYPEQTCLLMALTSPVAVVLIIPASHSPHTVLPHRHLHDKMLWISYLHGILASPFHHFIIKNHIGSNSTQMIFPSESIKIYPLINRVGHQLCWQPQGDTSMGIKTQRGQGGGARRLFSNTKPLSSCEWR